MVPVARSSGSKGGSTTLWELHSAQRRGCGRVIIKGCQLDLHLPANFRGADVPLNLETSQVDGKPLTSNVEKDDAYPAEKQHVLIVFGYECKKD